LPIYRSVDSLLPASWPVEVNGLRSHVPRTICWQPSVEEQESSDWVKVREILLHSGSTRASQALAQDRVFERAGADQYHERMHHWLMPPPLSYVKFKTSRRRSASAPSPRQYQPQSFVGFHCKELPWLPTMHLCPRDSSWHADCLVERDEDSMLDVPDVRACFQGRRDSSRDALYCLQDVARKIGWVFCGPASYLLEFKLISGEG
jgi:hypothetical protein